jgi:hypothetical protein
MALAGEIIRRAEQEAKQQPKNVVAACNEGD